MRFYIDNFGATMKDEAPDRDIQLNPHGLRRSITTISPAQNREQMMGRDEIALQTDNYATNIARLRTNGAHAVLERVSNGRHVAFIEVPGGAQMELVEKMA